MKKGKRWSAALATSVALFATLSPQALASDTVVPQVNTLTPIHHLVVIFDENVSFDHYFATYPNAANPAGEPPFYAAPGTPSVNGLSGSLLTHNPNGVNPQRLDRSQAVTPDMNHNYTPEQQAVDGGRMDNFINTVGRGNPIDLDYYDGNTVTALWYYAQHFALNDNAYCTQYGPSTPGAINLISGDTAGATVYSSSETSGAAQVVPPGSKNFPNAVTPNGVDIGDIDPYYDSASKGMTMAMAGKNIGDLLNAKGVTWGWFQGGFANPNAKDNNIAGTDETTDYSAHHEPFQYYASTANPNHLPPTSVAMIGRTDQANHQYDITNFFQALQNGNMPAVSFLKAPEYEDGHAGYSDPLDEQRWLVQTINQIEASPDWSSTAIIITYDDSDGWYDHVMPPLVNGSSDKAVDVLGGTPVLQNGTDRAGYGPRVPFLVISPYAKHNFVDNTLIDQTSVLRFIEENWGLGSLGPASYDSLAGSIMNMFDWNTQNPPVFLDPTTGEPVSPDMQPEVIRGTTYLSLNHYAQNLDVVLQTSRGMARFSYEGHEVEIDERSGLVRVDGEAVHLKAPLVRVDGVWMVPVEEMDSLIGATLHTYTDGHLTYYLFSPQDAH
ncbi:phospholipase C [Alicyclobacillus vulcanalis]|uniref:Phospholipase C n=1 Tax=Alicyclobacillus vulcanalis TaxID=252246 RepID=A0A1N7KQH8_9BACL|nr:alkaline phosphatase family protein [Alicyclobacillus vulcanalis]SIS63848.1 phospholipase C [Alicyclobacillus vulcanalis]